MYASTLNRELLDNMLSAIRGETKKKAIFYSGHDTNLFLRLVYHNLTSAECLYEVLKGESVPDCIDSVIPMLEYYLSILTMQVA